MKGFVRRVKEAFRADPDGRGSIASNGTWGTLQQLVNVGSQALVSFLLVMVLSVQDFGVYSYAVVMTSIGINFMSAGLSGLAIKVLVKDPEDSPRLVTSIFLIRESMAVVAYILLGVISLTSGSNLVIIATLISSLALFARAGDAPEFWFKSQMRTRVPASIRMIVTLGFLAVRLVLLAFIDSLLVFLAIYVLEAMVAGVWILVRYRSERRSVAFAKPSKPMIAGLTRQSFPLFLSSTANQINLRGDVIFIQAILGSSAVGIYAAAARLSEIAYFLPSVFMDATLPSLVKLHAEHGEHGHEFRRVMQRSYDRAFWTGVGIAVAIGVVGSLLIDIFFDPVYQASKPLLWIGLGACPFIFMSAVYSKWILTISTLWSSVVRHGAGAALNIALNLILLPVIGVVGASIASLASYIVASYLACFIGRRTWIAGVQMSLAIIAPLRFLVGRLAIGSGSKDR